MLRGFATRRKEQARLEAIIASSGADLDNQPELASVEYQKRNETQEIFIPVGERLGGKLIELRNVRKSFGDRLLLDRLSFSVPPGAIVGIIGPNGAGKSKLFRMLTGSEQPDSGEIEIGDTVRLAYLDQSRDCLDGNTTVCEEISGFLDRISSHILACEGDWQWTFFGGNDHDYEEDKRRRLGEEASRPKRNRYRPIAR
jgi:ATPase subunit of ABC transporter with duplicated ATPase domains